MKKKQIATLPDAILIALGIHKNRARIVLTAECALPIEDSEYQIKLRNVRVGDPKLPTMLLMVREKPSQKIVLDSDSESRFTAALKELQEKGSTFRAILRAPFRTVTFICERVPLPLAEA